MIYTQKEIYDYLLLNPLNVDVAVGDVESLNGKDYLFFDYIDDVLISSDDRGVYKTSIQITVATRDFANRRTLVNYIKDFLNVAVNYDKATDFEYFLARCTCEVLMYEP